MSGIATPGSQVRDDAPEIIGLDVLPQHHGGQADSWHDALTWPTMPVRVGAMVWLTATLSLSGGGFPLLGN